MTIKCLNGCSACMAILSILRITSHPYNTQHAESRNSAGLLLNGKSDKRKRHRCWPISSEQWHHTRAKNHSNPRFEWNRFGSLKADRFELSDVHSSNHHINRWKSINLPVMSFPVSPFIPAFSMKIDGIRVALTGNIWTGWKWKCIPNAAYELNIFPHTYYIYTGIVLTHSTWQIFNKTR